MRCAWSGLWELSRFLDYKLGLFANTSSFTGTYLACSGDLRHFFCILD